MIRTLGAILSLELRLGMVSIPRSVRSIALLPVPRYVNSRVAPEAFIYNSDYQDFPSSLPETSRSVWSSGWTFVSTTHVSGCYPARRDARTIYVTAAVVEIPTTPRTPPCWTESARHLTSYLPDDRHHRVFSVQGM